MATILHPTPTRLALLRDIQVQTDATEVTRVRVYQYRDYDTGKLLSARYESGDGDRLVTARVREMAKAGWVRLGAAEHPSMYARCPWELTDLGRQVLAEASKEK